MSAQQGVFYLVDAPGGRATLKLLSSYAYRERKHLSNPFQPGEGLIGQCMLEKERILITEVPTDYVKIGSGQGEARPLSLIVLPAIFEGRVKAVIELASFHRFSDIHLAFLEQRTESIAIVLNTIAAACGPRSCSISRSPWRTSCAASRPSSRRPTAASSSRRSRSRPRRSGSRTSRRSCSRKQVHDADPGFVDKHVLIVDDDARNIFALTAGLERHMLIVSDAENGMKGTTSRPMARSASGGCAGRASRPDRPT